MTDLRVGELERPVRLDNHLVEVGLARTRSQAKSWIDAGCVHVDGKPQKAGFLVRGGEWIDVEAPLEAAGASPEPEDIPLTVLHVDEHFVAIDKPAGMVIHPAPGSWSGTLVNALLFHGWVVIDESRPERPGIVHRLDKETSGVVLVARNGAAHEALAMAFRERAVAKRYVAITLGAPKRTSGTLDWSIGRHPRDRMRMSVRSPRGRTAKTTYRVLERLGDLALVELAPETGRTHQIRVHLATLGHPVLADPLYGARKGRARPSAGVASHFPRQALHAAAITFPHPVTGREMRIESPMPADMRALIEELRHPSGER